MSLEKRFEKYVKVIKSKETVLLVIDMQNDFVDKKGKLAFGQLPENASRIIIPIKLLVDFCHSQAIQVIFVKIVYSPDFKEVSAFSSSKKLGALKYGTWGAEIIKEIKPSKIDYILIKHRYSAFYSTNLDLLLRNLKTKNIILSGVSTNVCVESTARDAYFRDIFPIVIEDCVAAASMAEHHCSLISVTKHFGTVLTLKEVMKILDRNK